MLLEITIPVYNEELRLEKGIQELQDFLLNRQISANIVIADNGSKDRTLEIAQNLVTQHANVQLIAFKEKGVGRALRGAWGQSKADIVGYMDVDLSTDLKHLPEALALFQKDPTLDLVTGSRLIKGAQVELRKPLRTFTSIVLNILVRLFLRTKTTDVMCGFKFIRRDKYEFLHKVGILNYGWFFNAEIVIKSHWLGLHVVELPVHWVDDENSKVKVGRLGREYIGNIRELAAQKKEWLRNAKNL